MCAYSKENDCNPIENMWHELKEVIRCEVKRRGKQELIETYWNLFKDFGELLMQEYASTICKKLFLRSLKNREKPLATRLRGLFSNTD